MRVAGACFRARATRLCAALSLNSQDWKCKSPIGAIARRRSAARCTQVFAVSRYDGTTQRLYVNGVQVSSRAQTGAILVSASPLRIGGNSFG